ncbi:MAG: hypothetical protein HW390_3005 [Candidatus Brocadiaceae bacterium]|nr:hypothetical protein [Candidatus Brocadiaceae bacterium]
MTICRKGVLSIEEVPHETFCVMRQNVSGHLCVIEIL